MNRPLVSVVTPFHNTAKYLSECIESVLCQSYSNFEYVLVDNCSTDGSSEIARQYADRDSRIRLIRRSTLLPQVQNYNVALAEISTLSQYCKVVQADDYIFPDCLGLMVNAFEQSKSVGLVSAYDLKANVVRGSGFPLQTMPIAGKEVVRQYFRLGVFVFGSPTTVMYRSSLVRDHHPFYDESLLHEDTEKCIQILKSWDFAFVYQVLSFLRVDTVSISGSVRDLAPNALDRYILVKRYASEFLDEAEAHAFEEQERREYYGILALAALHFRDHEFWEYHKAGLKTIGTTIDRPYLGVQVLIALARLSSNPGATVDSICRALRRRFAEKTVEESRSHL